MHPICRGTGETVIMESHTSDKFTPLVQMDVFDMRKRSATRLARLAKNRAYAIFGQPSERKAPFNFRMFAIIHWGRACQASFL
jgi:hypothetical protein